MIAARRNACDDSRRNMFHKYVCCIEYSPPAITLQCQCSPRRAPHEFSISISRRNACDDSRRNMFHKYVCCIEYSPPAITLQCQCSPRRAPHDFSISMSLCMTLSNKCSCIRSRHEDKVPVFFYKGAGWPSRGALRIALCDVTLVFSFYLYL